MRVNVVDYERNFYVLILLLIPKILVEDLVAYYRHRNIHVFEKLYI